MTQKKKKTEHKEEGKFNDYFLKFIFKVWTFEFVLSSFELTVKLT